MTEATLVSPNTKETLKLLLPKILLPLGGVVMVLGFAAVDPVILSGGNLYNILVQASYLMVFALAQTIVLITRGFDLSLGTCVSAVSVATAIVLSSGDGGAGGLLLGVGAGVGLALVIGAVNGWMVTVLQVNPFIATLGMLNVCLGIASTLSSGRPVVAGSEAFTTIFYQGTVFGLPAPVLWAGGSLIVLHFVLRHTVFGRSLSLIGGNTRAAYVAGLPVRRTITAAYVLCAVLAALGAMLLTARTGSGEPNLGGNLTLESIAAAVVGGASLRGGVGGISAAILGALFVTALSNGMNLTRLDGNVQTIVLGCVIVGAVFLDRFRAGRH